MRLPSELMMGNLPFLESRRMSLASVRVMPCCAVTRFVVITWESGAKGSRNWMSRAVTMPTSLPPTNPVSAT